MHQRPAFTLTLRSVRLNNPASTSGRPIPPAHDRHRSGPFALPTGNPMPNDTPSARELLRNAVKDKLARNELVLSMTARLVRTVEIAAIARTAGFDSIYVDMEHSSFSLDTTGQICMAALAAGVTPFVRVPGTSPEHIAQVLDGGALGVIVPHVMGPEDAKRAVHAAKFPPFGGRSFAGVLPHLGFRAFPTTDVFEAMNEATMVVAMVETAEALAEVEGIAAVDGVDMLFVGTNDLCGALGVPGQLNHASVRDAFRKCFDACRKHGKHLGLGGLGGQPQLLSEYIGMGARYVSSGTDLAFLVGEATARAKALRAL